MTHLLPLCVEWECGSIEWRRFRIRADGPHAAIARLRQWLGERGARALSEQTGIARVAFEEGGVGAVTELEAA